MPRRLLQKITPDPASLRDLWLLRPFGERLADPQLWTLHRRDVTYAFGAGLAICFIPLPVHLALRLRGGAAVAAEPAGHLRHDVPAQSLHHRAGLLPGLPRGRGPAARAAPPFPLRGQLALVRARARPGVEAVPARLPGVRRRRGLPRLARPRDSCGAGRCSPATAPAATPRRPEARRRPSCARSACRARARRPVPCAARASDRA